MRHSIKYWFFKLKYVVAFTVFLIFVGFVGESSCVNRWGQKQEISRLQEEIDEYDRKFEKDKQTLNALKNDPEAVKRVARSRYYMKTDDEDVFLIEEEE